MNSVNTILNLITKNCYVALADLSDAYYKIDISE